VINNYNIHGLIQVTLERDKINSYSYLYYLTHLFILIIITKITGDTKMSNTQELGLAAMYRIMKKSGAERVSDEAAEQLRKIIEEIALRISRQAVDLSIHAGRRTIKSGDIQLAAKNLLNLST
jgi:DNA-binding protein